MIKAARAICVMAALVCAIAVVLPASTRLTHGFASYYTAAKCAREGRAGPWYYDDAAFAAETNRLIGRRASDIFWANPPTASLILLPLAGLSPEVARRVWVWASFALFILALVLLIRLLAPVNRPEAARAGVLCIAAASFVSAPLAAAFALGQAYVLLLLLMALSLWGLRHNRHGIAGLGLALALVLKASGLPLWLLLAARKQWRALGWASLWAAVLVVGTMPLLGPAMWRVFVKQVVPAFVRDPILAVTAYQTVPGFWRHLFLYDAVWNSGPLMARPALASVLSPLTALALLGAGALRAPRATVEWVFCVGLILSVILVPAAEQHHFVLLFPALLLAGRAATLRPPRVFWLAAALGLLLLPLPYSEPAFSKGWLALLAYPRLYGALILLIDLLRHPEPVPI